MRNSSGLVATSRIIAVLPGRTMSVLGAALTELLLLEHKVTMPDSSCGLQLP